MHDVARAHTGDYNLLVRTVLDPTIPLGLGRDTDKVLREAVDRHITELVAEFAPAAVHLEAGRDDELLDHAEQLALAAVDCARRAKP